MINTQKLVQKKQLLIFVAVFSLTVIMFLIVRSFASSDIAIFEAEDAVATTFADIAPDQAASNGEFIQFGDLTVPPNPDPDPNPEPDPQPGDILFSEDFTDPASYNRFDTITWHRDPHLGGGSFEADHAPVASGNDPDNCTNPFSTRTIGRDSKRILVESGKKHVYRCAPGDSPAKAHIMTAQGPESGYDFTAAWTKESFSNITEVQWDQNITDLGGRNWSEIKIVPVRTWDPLQPPCGIEWVPCFTLAEGGNGGDPDGSAVRTHAEMDSIGLNWSNGSPLLVTQFATGKAFRNAFRSDAVGSVRWEMEPVTQAFSSPAPRFTHILRDNNDGTVTALLDTKTEKYGLFEITTVEGNIPDEASVIVLSTHDYTSGKSEGDYNGKTWHWDNIIVK